MATLTPEEHDEHKALASELIEAGRVHSWRELGRAFGISAQAAQMRFGNQYGLVMPARVRTERQMVSVSLDAELAERLERLREQSSHDSRAGVVRELLREHLPA